MKCQLKPNILDCFQWTGGPDQTEDPEWIVEAIKKGDVYFRNYPTKGPLLIVKTDEGHLVAKPGDYIVKGFDIYPVSQAGFKERYEIVDTEQ